MIAIRGSQVGETTARQRIKRRPWYRAGIANGDIRAPITGIFLHLPSVRHAKVQQWEQSHCTAQGFL